jgi:dCMP deaminase
MSDENCVSIKIIKKIPFFGEGDSLANRLRKVSLRGFPPVKIYENSEFEPKVMSREEVFSNLQIPQPNVYNEKLKRIEILYKLFIEQGINIFNLDYAYDFIAISESGEETQWTMIPPIVEQFRMPKNYNGTFNYGHLIGEELKKTIQEKGYIINPGIHEINYPRSDDLFNEINDGSHRIHCAIENGFSIKVIIIKNITFGFPYYAIPFEYSNVKLIEKRDEFEKETKIHIIDPPGHKELYRLFPSGGIMTGEVRSDPKIKDEGKKPEIVEDDILSKENLKIKILYEKSLGERPSWDEYFMKMAISASSRSSCHKVQSGSVIVCDNKILGTGYNGAPPGITSCYERGYCFKEKITGKSYEENIGKGNCIAAHSEMNALAHLNKLLHKDATLYTTIFPCLQCSKIIIAYKINKIVFKKKYEGEEMERALNLFNEAGIEVCQLDLSKERTINIDINSRASTFGIWD